MNITVTSTERVETQSAVVRVRIEGVEPRMRHGNGKRSWRPEHGTAEWRRIRSGGRWTRWTPSGVWLGGPYLNLDGLPSAGAEAYEPVPGGASGGGALSDAILAATRPPEAEETRKAAASAVSVALGATGAPYEDICHPEWREEDVSLCEHETCDAVAALVAADLLR